MKQAWSQMSNLVELKSNTTSRYIRLPESLSSVVKFFSDNQIEAYLTGGAIRNLLMGIDAVDFDVSINSFSPQIAKDLSLAINFKVHLIDPDREVYRLVDGCNDLWIDIKPLQGDILEDLALRDFSIDAMAVFLELSKGESRIIDPYGGIEDINDCFVRALDKSVFIEDPIRLMRAPRIASQLNFEIHSETLNWIGSYAKNIDLVSTERIREELLKILDSKSSVKWLRLLDKLGILCTIIPELECARGVTQPVEHHWDVFDHSIETVGAIERLLQLSDNEVNKLDYSVPKFQGMRRYFDKLVSDSHRRLSLLKLAGLLHDVSKPATKTVELSGKVRFLGHASEGAKVVKEVLERLRFSGKGVEYVMALVEHHLRPGQLARRGELPSSRAIYRYYRDLEDIAIDCIYLNLADYLSARGPSLEYLDWERHCDVARHIINAMSDKKGIEKQVKLLNGIEIMDIFGIDQGPIVGNCLELVSEAHALGEINTKSQAIALVSKSLNQGGIGA